jgi:DNA polymerase-3 subunit beta
MKIEVSKTELLRALEVAERAVNPKSPLPIYAALMLETSGETLQMTGTNGELTMTAKCPAEGEVEAGKLAVIAEGFVSVVKGLKGPLISIQQVKSSLVVTSGRSKYSLPLLTGEAWPVIPNVGEESRFTVHERALAVQLGRVLPAVGTDASRQVVCGVFFKLGEDNLALVATDTHRLHVATVTVPKMQGPTSFILATAPAKELARVLEADDDCNVVTDGSCLKIEGSWGTFISTLISGTYLNYERFVPQRSEYAEFDRSEFSEAVRRAAFVAQGCADRLVVTLDGEGGEAVLEASSEQYGEAEERLTIRSGDCDGQVFAVSARNLGAAVFAVPDPLVRLYRSASTRAILIGGEDTSRFFAVVIPMRLPTDA